MSHEIEVVNGKAKMAYAGEVPWHGLGVLVNDDLTPVEMLKAAELDWTVQKVPAFATVNKKKISVGRSALVRSSDYSILDIVGDDWNPVQNLEAFEFFNEFIEAGQMQMHTAGSLRSGQIVWALAKVDESFTLFKGDQVDSYLLFSNPHKFGQAIDIRFTPIRVVCKNTLTLSLQSASSQWMKLSHRRVFDGDEVKEMMGIASHKLTKYKEMASFLGSKQAKGEDIVTYFKRIFPVLSTKDVPEKEISKSATRCLDVLETQPGANFAKGTWWPAYNAVTYFTDHLAGRSVDNRLTSAWYGANKSLKVKALETALEMASV